MPDYPHICLECNYEWEDFYSAKQDPPTKCPSCGTEGKVKRLIAGDVQVRVQLGRLEWKAKIKEDVRKMKQDMKTDENLRANFVGESKYQETQTAVSEIKKNLKNI